MLQAAGKNSNSFRTHWNIQPGTLLICLFIIGVWAISAFHHNLSMFATQKSSLLVGFGAINGASLERGEYWTEVTMKFFLQKKRELKPNMREPLILPFRGGELLGLFLDNFTDQTELIKATILKNEQLSNRPSMPSLVAYDVTDTEVTTEIAECLIDSMLRMSPNIRKLAFVGATRPEIKRIKKGFEKHGHEIDFAINYFFGHEPAKEWLIPN